MAVTFVEIVDAITADSFSALMTRERQEKIEDVGKSWDFYYGNQEMYIKQYRGEDDDDYEDKDKMTFNYTKGVVDEYVDGVFAKPVHVAFKDPKNQKVWDELTGPMKFVQMLPFMTKVQRIAEISEMCLVMLRYDKEKKKTYFEDVRGEFVHFIPDETNPREIGTLVVCYLFDTGDPHPNRRFLKRIELWDKTHWEIWLYSPVLKQRKLIDEGDNPYGFIPAVRFVPEEDDNTFYGQSNIHDVVKVNEVYNNLWTSLVRICVFQSFSILVMKSAGNLKIDVAPTRFIKFENDDESADAEYITPAPNIGDVEKVLMDLKLELIDFSKVPTSVVSSSDSEPPQSGYALRIKRIPIEQMWEKRRMSMGPAYRTLSQMAVTVDEVNKGSGSKGEITEDEIEVDFTETLPGLSPTEQALSDAQDMQYGLVTAVDLMLRKSPEMTREEALKKIKENRAETKSLGMDELAPPGNKQEQKKKLQQTME